MISTRYLAAIFAVFVSVSAVTIVPAHAESAINREYQVKAAYIIKFLNFIEWRGSLANGGNKQICVVGDNPFGDALDIFARRFQTDVEVRAASADSDLDSCHVVFVSRSETRRLDLLVERLGSSGAVAISDIKGFADRGGLIELILAERHVRFIINEAKANQRGFRLSAQLLALARELVSFGTSGQLSLVG